MIRTKFLSKLPRSGWLFLWSVPVACSLQIPKEGEVFAPGGGRLGGASGSSTKPNDMGGGGASSGGTSGEVTSGGKDSSEIGGARGDAGANQTGGATSNGGGSGELPASAGATSNGGGSRKLPASAGATSNGGGSGESSATGGQSSSSASAAGAVSTGGVSTRGGGAGNGGTTATGGFNAADGLVSHYTFDETSGAVTENLMDATKNGTYVGGCTHTTGRVGGAVQVRNLNSDVAGSSDWIELPAGILSGFSVTTISLWVRDLSSARRGGRAFHFSRGAGEEIYFSPHQVNSVDSTEGAHLGGTHAGTSFVDLWSTSPAFTDKVWHHVAITWSSENITLYIDAKSVGSQASPGVRPSDLGATSPNWLGRTLDDAYIAIYAEMDDLRIYDRALTAAEIAQLYQML